MATSIKKLQGNELLKDFGSYVLGTALEAKATVSKDTGQLARVTVIKPITNGFRVYAQAEKLLNEKGQHEDYAAIYAFDGYPNWAPFNYIEEASDTMADYGGDYENMRTGEWKARNNSRMRYGSGSANISYQAYGALESWILNNSRFPWL